ncbi:hypothetical protein CONLIGDRAFT_465642 [Coniochaeta ligniaria NRRL 30616]|uniref:Uncharacterized protein n=1 Tax=Coniochaeta ligniaria NRRL 30616 TaxID=1408157 RepID=A0A1J7I3B6_9PEZI|nr:hypothetical protein CONLIGDRAFT_465642 [Coniochaeta ligniaria NRRL 30616]
MKNLFAWGASISSQTNGTTPTCETGEKPGPNYFLVPDIEPAESGPSTRWQDRSFAKLVEDPFAAAVEAWSEAPNLERIEMHIRSVTSQLDGIEASLQDNKTNERDRRDDETVRFDAVEKRLDAVESTQTPPTTVAEMGADLDKLKHDIYNPDTLGPKQ